MKSKYQLVTAVGTGSCLVEAMLVYKNVPFEMKQVDYEAVVNQEPEVVKLNPISELPILILPNGKVMTESAAIALYLDEKYPNEPSLGLPVSHPQRDQFLRWLVFLVAAIYPTFTYADDPSDWVKNEEGALQLKHSLDQHKKTLWKMMDREVSDGPFWMGDSFTVLDIYLTVMSRWRPGRQWFEENCPKLKTIIQKVDEYPVLKKVWERNFNS